MKSEPERCGIVGAVETLLGPAMTDSEEGDAGMVAVRFFFVNRGIFEACCYNFEGRDASKSNVS